MSCPFCEHDYIVYKVFSIYKTKYVSVPQQFNQCSVCGEQWHSSFRSGFELRKTTEELENKIGQLELENRGLDTTIDQLSNRIHGLEQNIQDIQNGDILGVIDYKSGQDMGVIESVDSWGKVTISKETWSPGLWCGMEGKTVVGIDPREINMGCFEVEKIYLMKREIRLDRGTYLRKGDVLRLA